MLYANAQIFKAKKDFCQYNNKLKFSKISDA